MILARKKYLGNVSKGQPSALFLINHFIFIYFLKDEDLNLATVLKCFQKQHFCQDEEDSQSSSSDSGNDLHVIVHRRKVLYSAFKAMSSPSFCWKKSPKVEFVGEEGADYGGPQREFFRWVISNAMILRIILYFYPIFFSSQLGHVNLTTDLDLATLKLNSLKARESLFCNSLLMLCEIVFSLSKTLDAGCATVRCV